MSRPEAQTKEEPERGPEDQGTVTSPPQSSPSERMAARVIAMERKIDFNFFESYGFLVGQWIKTMGWKSFCSLDVPMYPHLVREFYANLRRGPSEIVSSVKGVQFEISEDRFA